SGPRPAPPLSRRPRQAPRRRKPPPSPRGPSRSGRRVLVALVLLVIAAAVVLAVLLFQPFHGDPSGVVRVKIPAGANAGAIGDLLAQRDVVSSGTFFALNATATGRRGALRAGTYTLQHDMAYGDVLDALAKGPKAKALLQTFQLTVPEGLSRREIAPLAAKGGAKADYLKASASPKALGRAHALGLPRGARSVEGFLFPATYDLVKGSTAADLVDKQLAAYADNVAAVDFKRAQKARLTRYDVLTIASMIERETELDRERPLVAAVIYNRLKDGMPLGIDATIRYAENNWSSPLKVSELQRDGPYNTRLRRGLPPTPIGNPGLASLKAAAHPSKVGYRYYVVRPGTRGHAFSSTDAQFARDVARYNAARARNGGKSPG
ncbi:MAG: endolytic transglycosylase MltG, partial [Solirubrobacteraceae bacterium]